MSPTVPDRRDSPRIGRSGERKPPALSLPDGAPAAELAAAGSATTSSVASSQLERIDEHLGPHLARVARAPPKPTERYVVVVGDRQQSGGRQLLHRRQHHLGLGHVRPRVAEARLSAQGDRLRLEHGVAALVRRAEGDLLPEGRDLPVADRRRRPRRRRPKSWKCSATHISGVSSARACSRGRGRRG